MKNVIVFILVLCLSSCNSNTNNDIEAQKLYLQGCQFLRESDFEKAKESFLAIIAKYPDSKFALEANKKLDEVYEQLKIQSEKISNKEAFPEEEQYIQKALETNIDTSPKEDANEIVKMEDKDSETKLNTETKIDTTDSKVKESNVREVTEIKAKLENVTDYNAKETEPKVYQKLTKMDEISSLIEYADAILEEKNGNKEQAIALYKRIIVLYPLSVGAVYAKVRMEKNEDKHERNLVRTLHVYQDILEIMKQDSYEKRQELLSKLSTQGVVEELSILHKALLDYYIEIGYFVKLLADEKSDLEVKNLVHFANSHFVMKDIEWSKSAYSKVIEQRNHYVDLKNTKFSTNKESENFSLGLKMRLNPIETILNGFQFGNSVNQEQQNLNHNSYQENTAENRQLEHQSEEHIKITTNQKAQPLQVETLSTKLKEDYYQKLKLIDEWKTVYNKISTYLYKDEAILALYQKERELEIHFQLQKWEKAKDICQTLMEMDEDAISYKLLLLHIDYCLANYDAVVNNGKILESKSKVYQLYEIQGLAYLKKSDLEKSIQYLTLANNINENIANSYALTCAYSQKNEFEIAYNYLEKAHKYGLIAYEDIINDEDINKSFLSFPKFAKLLHKQQQGIEIQQTKRSLRELIEKSQFFRASELLEKNYSLGFISDDVYKEFSYTIYFPLAREATKDFQNQIKKQNPQAKEIQQEAIGYLNKISNKNNDTEELGKILNGTYYYDYYDDLKLYSLKYLYNWELEKKEDSTIWKDKEKQEGIGIAILHNNESFPFLDNQNFYLVADVMADNISKQESSFGQISVISSQKSHNFFRNFPAATYPFDVVKNNRPKKKGHLYIIHWGEYIVFFFEISPFKVIEKLEFIGEPNIKKLYSQKIYANDGWQKFDLPVLVGQKVNLKIEGRWTLGTTNRWPYHGPEGTNVIAWGGEHRILKNSTLGSLIMQFNNQYEEIRLREYSFFAVATGYVFFRVNDDKTGDNSGHLEITATTYFPKIIGTIMKPNTLTVTQVLSGSPCQVAGIGVGDTITHVNGKKVNSLTEFENAYKYVLPGKSISVTVRNYKGYTREKKVTIKLYPWR